MNKIHSLINTVSSKLNQHTTLKDIPSILNPIPPVYEIKNIVVPDDYKNQSEVKNNLYLKNEIFRNSNIIAYMILWQPKIISPIHNHNDPGCFYKPLSNGIVEHKYIEKEDYLHYIARKECCPTYTHFINDYIGLHSMENTNNFISSSIHIYPNQNDKF